MTVIPLPLEHALAHQALAALEHGDPAAAPGLLQRALGHRKPPPEGQPDKRPIDIVRLRGYIEQAIIEIEAGYLGWAVETLRRGLRQV